MDCYCTVTLDPRPTPPGTSRPQMARPTSRFIVRRALGIARLDRCLWLCVLTGLQDFHGLPADDLNRFLVKAFTDFANSQIGYDVLPESELKGPGVAEDLADMVVGALDRFRGQALDGLGAEPLLGRSATAGQNPLQPARGRRLQAVGASSASRCRSSPSSFWHTSSASQAASAASSSTVGSRKPIASRI
jgi:hypothetical protein